MTNQDAGVLRRDRQLGESPFRRASQGTSIFSTEETFVAWTCQLFQCCVKEDWARQVSAALIKRHELVFRRPQQDAGIVRCGIAEQLVSPHRNFPDARDIDGLLRLAGEFLEKLSARRG